MSSKTQHPDRAYIVAVIRLDRDKDSGPALDPELLNPDALIDLENDLWLDSPNGGDQTGYEVTIVSSRPATEEEIAAANG